MIETSMIVEKVEREYRSARDAGHDPHLRTIVMEELDSLSNIDIIRILLEENPEVLHVCPDDWTEWTDNLRYPSPSSLIRGSYMDWIIAEVEKRLKNGGIEP